jgi:predicted TIM-barrel fold metal-dependent hydrolase
MAEAVLASDQPLFSADSHVVEPANLWLDYIEPAFRERAPHVERQIRRRDGTLAVGEFLVCEGIAPQPVANFAAADVEDPRQRAEANRRGYAELRQGGWDPQARLRDQRIDGVDFEVLYPSMAMPMFGIAEVPFQQAVFAAYNRWAADFAAALPGRLVAVALIGLDDLAWAEAELKRSRELGLRGAMIWNDPGPGRSYADRDFDRFWAAAADLDMPLSLHILTGKTGTGLGSPHFLRDYMALTHPVQSSLAAMLTSGVFARHPRLRVVSVENDVGWLAHFLYRLEHAYQQFRYLVEYRDPRSPLEYFHEHCWATFQDDPVGLRTLEWIGPDRLMWASDYPHGDSTWPESRATIERTFAGVETAAVRRIVHDNVAGLYRL